uniref:Uncharacterized protein n=1 Tax=Panagrolaimus superbus TaxID=310955 RepID=A0A914Y2N4_9BILA
MATSLVDLNFDCIKQILLHLSSTDAIQSDEELKLNATTLENIMSLSRYVFNCGLDLFRKTTNLNFSDDWLHFQIKSYEVTYKLPYDFKFLKTLVAVAEFKELSISYFNKNLDELVNIHNGIDTLIMTEMPSLSLKNKMTNICHFNEVLCPFVLDNIWEAFFFKSFSHTLELNFEELLRGLPEQYIVHSVYRRVKVLKICVPEEERDIFLNADENSVLNQQNVENFATFLRNCFPELKEVNAKFEFYTQIETDEAATIQNIFQREWFHSLKFKSVIVFTLFGPELENQDVEIFKSDIVAVMFHLRNGLCKN